MHGSVATVSGANLDDRLVDESALHDSSGFDADELSPLFFMEQNLAFGKGEKGIVLSPPDIGPGVELRTPLPYQDFAGFHLLAAKPLYAQPLGG
jgi:hypothetical protein